MPAITQEWIDLSREIIRNNPHDNDYPSLFRRKLYAKAQESGAVTEDSAEWDDFARQLYDIVKLTPEELDELLPKPKKEPLLQRLNPRMRLQRGIDDQVHAFARWVGGEVEKPPKRSAPPPEPEPVPAPAAKPEPEPIAVSSSTAAGAIVPAANHEPIHVNTAPTPDSVQPTALHVNVDEEDEGGTDAVFVNDEDDVVAASAPIYGDDVVAEPAVTYRADREERRGITPARVLAMITGSLSIALWVIMMLGGFDIYELLAFIIIPIFAVITMVVSLFPRA